MDGTDERIDPHAEIERLEARIEELAARIENCRKFQLAARIAMALGGAWLVAIVIGAVRSDPLALTAAIAAVLGGIVLSGSNGSTAKEASAQLTQAEANRAALIGVIELRTVAERTTLHQRGMTFLRIVIPL
jgi:hypothetical protein